jgi:hypothetical protein
MVFWLQHESRLAGAAFNVPAGHLWATAGAVQQQQQQQQQCALQSAVKGTVREK